MLRYRPPFDEFMIEKVTASVGAVLQVPAKRGPQILLYLRGGAIIQASGPGAQLPQVLTSINAAMGTVLFIPAETELVLDITEETKFYVAAVNED